MPDKNNEYQGNPDLITTQEGRVGFNDAGRVFNRDTKVNGLAVAAIDAKSLPPPFNFKPWVFKRGSEIEPRQFLYGRHITRGFVSMTLATGGIGKSSLETVECLAMVTGRPLLGIQPHDRLTVGMWNGEDPMDELDRRIAAAAEHYGIEEAAIGDRLHVVSGRDNPLVIARQEKTGPIVYAPVVDAVVAAIQEAKLDVVVIDPFAYSHEVSENDNNAIAQVAKTWAQIADRTGVAIELVHHVRKTQPGTEITAEDGRGAGALLAATRSTRVLNRMSREEATEFGLLTERELYFKVGIGKLNLAPAIGDPIWFKMHSHPLGNGRPGWAADEIGVATRWTPPDPLALVTPTTLDAIKARLQGDARAARDNADDWIGCDVAAIIGLDVGPKTKADRTAAQEGDRSRVKTLIGKWKAAGTLVDVECKGKDRKPRPGLCFA
jgi:hypothetical protein